MTKDNPNKIPIDEVFKVMSRHKLQASSSPDDLTKKEEVDFEKSIKEHRLTELGLQNKSLEDLINLRQEYSKKVFIFLIVWSIGVGLVLIFQAFGIWGFSLPESVLNILVGSTTVNVIALVGLVVKGLFPGRESG